ncbi:unnamed protein product [Arctia plantaginis]|uniref:Uncharacterized protein n=1 Tax=Arctia plantaginis TaxID=874455 RepID=A0A8S1BFL5_ARCPL|nr:unnamed protein product [Arctia plantaginis]
MDIKFNSVADLLQTNICRCCLRNIPCYYKNISEEYYSSGTKRNYEEMLLNTFNIQFSQYDVEGYLSYICEECSAKIREASAFKDMVLSSEERFAKLMDRLQYGNSEIQAENEVKVEHIKSESSAATDFCDDSMDDNEILANIKLELTQNGDLESEVNKNNHDRKLKLRKKSRLKSEIGKDQKDWTKIAERRGNGPILRENSLKLLANSTIFVFQWNKSRYRCFCCKEPFSDVKSLREHTTTKHNLKSIEKKIINQQNRLVKVEISELKCNLCSQNQQNLEILRDHLIESHKIQFESKEDLLVPFKINDNLACQICSEKFSVFRLLNIHMNRHFQKQVCHICGAAFSNLVFLNLHKTRYHKPLKCHLCDLNFNNKIEKKNHDILVHNVKFERKLRFPCPYCNERFYQENIRVQHLVEKHGLKRPEYRCSICSKAFITKSLCNNHLKTVHLKEKHHECEICHNFFYTKSSVARHMVTHTGEKNYSCAMCNNPFASKDSLRRHMRRTHGVH